MDLGAIFRPCNLCSLLSSFTLSSVCCVILTGLHVVQHLDRGVVLVSHSGMMLNREEVGSHGVLST